MRWLLVMLLGGVVAVGQTPNSTPGSAPWYCYYTHNWYHCGHADERRPYRPVLDTVPAFATLAVSAETVQPFTWGQPAPIEERAATATPDYIERRVLRAGGRIDGALRISLAWSNYDDLDLHVLEPTGHEIYFDNKQSKKTGGKLDVDMNVDTPLDATRWIEFDPGAVPYVRGRSSRSPVENVIYPDISRMVEGIYLVKINSWRPREDKNVGFTVEVEFGGKIYTFTYRDPLAQCNTVDVASISYHNGVFEIQPTPIKKEDHACPTPTFISGSGWSVGNVVIINGSVR